MKTMILALALALPALAVPVAAGDELTYGAIAQFEDV